MSLLYSTKKVLENAFSEDISVIVAEKPDWLILKDRKLDKTFGCIRFNKNSFATLYIDTKDDINLSEKFDIREFRGVDIKSRLTGNFYQNKFKFEHEDDIRLVMAAIGVSYKNNYIKLEDKIRS